MSTELESFYSSWQKDRAELIDYDNGCAVRKVETVLRHVPSIASLGIRTAIDFGCGRGQALRHFSERMQLERAYGFDFSAEAIEYASRVFGSREVQFQRLSTLDIDASVDAIKRAVPGGVDCILLLDLLEHVANCKHLVARLGELAKYFVIKLPVEANILDNYIFRNKVYPSTTHYNGHLREFNANSVFYFVRELGFTPLAEGLYLYDRADVAPQFARLPLLRSIKHGTVTGLRKLLSLILHKKLFITVCGPGGYYCVATFDPANVLNP